MQRAPMDKHQAIALALLVATVFALLVDTTRAVGGMDVAEPTPVTVQPAPPDPQPLRPVWDPDNAVPQRYVAQAEAVTA